MVIRVIACEAQFVIDRVCGTRYVLDVKTAMGPDDKKGTKRMSDATSGVMVVTYGTYRIEDFDALPVASKLALATSGLAHQLGNVVASEVSGAVDDAIMAGQPEGSKFDKDAMKALRVEWRKSEGNKATEAGWKKQFADEAFADLLAGRVGTRTVGPRGPKLDEHAALCREIAHEEIGEFLVARQVLARNSAGEYVIPGTNRKPVSGGKTPDKIVKIGELDLTMSQLVDRRLEHEAHAPRIKAEASKRIDAKRRALAKVASEGSLEEML